MKLKEINILRYLKTIKKHLIYNFTYVYYYYCRCYFQEK